MRQTLDQLIWINNDGDCIVFGENQIPLEALPGLWQRGHDEDSEKSQVLMKGTRVDGRPEAVAALAEAIRESTSHGEVNASLAADFVRAVCAWGGPSGRRVWGLVIKSQESRDSKERWYAEIGISHLGSTAWPIESALLSAVNECEKGPMGQGIESDLQLALEQNKWRIRVLEKIRKMGGLGVSYGSKVARFIGPEDFGVWDEVIANCLNRPKDSTKDFSVYSSDVKRIAEFLNSTGLTCSEKKNGGRWLAADVDLALWTYGKYYFKKALSSTPTVKEWEIGDNWNNATNHVLKLREGRTEGWTGRCECGERFFAESRSTIHRQYQSHCRDLGL